MVCVGNTDAAMLSEGGTVATHGKSVLDTGSGGVVGVAALGTGGARGAQWSQ